MRSLMFLAMFAGVAMADGPTVKSPQAKVARYKVAKGQSVTFTGAYTLCTDRSCSLEYGNDITIFRSEEAGEHVIAALANGANASVIITVDGEIGPVIPPKPPDIPPGPMPVNPLVAKFQDLFKNDPAPQAAKAKHLIALIELYSQAQDLAGDPAVLTSKNLQDRVAAAGKALVGDGNMVPLRVAIGEEVKADLGSGAKPLDKELREKAKARYKIIHDALKGVSP